MAFGLPFAVPAQGSLRESLKTLAAVALLWTLADLAYYFLLPAMGRAADYNGDPMAISLLYLFFVGVSVILFWPVYQTWGRYARWPTFGNRLVSLGLWVALFGGAVWYTGYVVPQIGVTNWPADWGPAPDIALATQAYFLPKTLEIMFQQLLIVAMILALAPLGLNFLRLSLTMAVLFGAIHLLLIFGDMPLIGVARFTVFAAGFGALLPLLVLRVRNGLAYAFLLHWSYYAFSVTMLRLVAAPG